MAGRDAAAARSSRRPSRVRGAAFGARGYRAPPGPRTRGVRRRRVAARRRSWAGAGGLGPGHRRPARPQIVELFPGAVYENAFGTVAVRRDHDVFEITTFRVEHDYADFRRPHRVEFGD